MAEEVKPTGRTLFVRNLPLTASDQSLEDTFSGIGPTKRCFVVKERGTGKSRGFGYVTFALGSDAVKAKNELKKLEGQKIHIDFADPKHKKKNPRKTKKDETSPTKEKPKKTTLDSDSDSDHEENAEEEQEEKPELSPEGKKGNKKMHVIDSKDRKEKKSKKWKLIIRNLSFWCSEDHLKEVFNKFGKVVEAHIPKKPDGRCFGYGFVQFSTYIEAHSALKQMNAQPIKGRPVAVDWALARDVYISQRIKASGSEVPKENRTETKNTEKRQDQVEQGLSDESEEDEGDADDSGEEDEEEDGEEDGEEDDEEDDEEDVDEDADEEADEEDASDDDDDDSDDDDEDEDDDDDSDDDDDEEDNDDDEDTASKQAVSVKKPQINKKNINRKSTDVNEGRTVFIRNISFDTLEEDLEDFCTEFGELNYCKLVIDPKTEHPRGTAFVQFATKVDADNFMEESSKDIQRFTLDGRKIDATLAVDRDKARELKKPSVDKEEKDKRNLWLVREGLIRAGTQAAQGLSKADIARRTKIEQQKREKLKNPNIFVSSTRLCVHNVPKSVEDGALRKICLKAANDRQARITECRIMRDMKTLTTKGSAKSLGYAFVNFSDHKHAVQALRHLNNNAEVFGNDKRLIVEFSLENKAALEAKKRRLDRHQIKEKTMKRNTGDNREYQNRGGMKNKNKSKILDIVAPVPTQEGEDRSKIPKGLPSHWGPKIRHNKRSLPAGKPTKKEKFSKKRPAPRDSTVEKPKKKRKGKSFEKRDAFDKLVDKYRQKISSAVK